MQMLVRIRKEPHRPTELFQIRFYGGNAFPGAGLHSFLRNFQPFNLLYALECMNAESNRIPCLYK